MSSHVIGGQLIRYVIVGLASNVVCYLIYLGLSTLGMDPKMAMTILYGVGVLQTFLFNKKWTFKQDGAMSSAFYRYFIVYGAGYLLNLFVLYVLVDLHGYPHQFVQATMIIVLAMMLFLSQKFWVFRPS